MAEHLLHHLDIDYSPPSGLVSRCVVRTASQRSNELSSWIPPSRKRTPVWGERSGMSLEGV
jgi:hypothetical protein